MRDIQSVKRAYRLGARHAFRAFAKVMTRETIAAEVGEAYVDDFLRGVRDRRSLRDIEEYEANSLLFSRHLG